MGLLKRLSRLIGSFGIAVVLLVLLLVLTWLGTLEQGELGLYETQKKYFESLLLVHWAGPFAFRLPGSDGAEPLFRIPQLPIPLVGGYLLLALLLLNLVVGGIVRLKKDARRAGILVAHVGIVMMLVAGFVKFRMSYEGSLPLCPKDYLGMDPSFPRAAESDEVQSFHDWELVACEAREGVVLEQSILNDEWEGVEPKSPRTFTSDALPFDVTITRAFENCWVYPKGPRFTGDGPTIDGYVVMKKDPAHKDDETNVPGLYATFTEKVTGRQTDAILWGVQSEPFTLVAGGKPWLVDLRRRTFRLPFRIRLDRFTFETHPGTMMESVFLSDVTKIEDGREQSLKITMNEPLRRGGWTLYQSGYGPQNLPPDAPHYSIFQVVKNPSDQWPKWSCYVIAAGLLWHFGSKLVRHVKSQQPHAVEPTATGPQQVARTHA